MDLRNPAPSTQTRRHALCDLPSLKTYSPLPHDAKPLTSIISPTSSENVSIFTPLKPTKTVDFAPWPKNEDIIIIPRCDESWLGWWEEERLLERAGMDTTEVQFEEPWHEWWEEEGQAGFDMMEVEEEGGMDHVMADHLADISQDFQWQRHYGVESLGMFDEMGDTQTNGGDVEMGEGNAKEGAEVEMMEVELTAAEDCLSLVNRQPGN